VSERSTGLRVRSHLPANTDIQAKKSDHVTLPKVGQKQPKGGTTKDDFGGAPIVPVEPTSKTEAPPTVGRPRLETVDTLWRKIDEALVGQSSLEAAIGQLSLLGFKLHSSKDGDAELRKDGFKLELDSKRIGAHTALKVELEGPEKGGKKPKKEGVAVEGTILPPELWHTMKARVEATMDEFASGLKLLGKDPLPTSFDGVKALIDSGRGAKVKQKEAVQDAQIAAALAELQAKIEDMKAKGIAPKKVVVYVDGPDGAGKSSTGAIVLQALAAAGYTTSAVPFKAPTAEERSQHWLKRFKDNGVPQGEFQAVLWDRGPAGDTVYGPRTPAEVAKMADEFKNMEQDLAKDGVLMLKLHIFADPEKQAETFGKRLGRQAVADEIEGRLIKAGKLTEVGKNQLDVVRHKIDGDDFRALVRFAEYQAKFKRFSKAAGMRMIDATKRHDARLEIISAFSSDLSAWGGKG
jgi:hypothetical protein